MPYKHPTDRKAWHRRNYQQNKDAIKEAAAQWYEDNKGTSEYKLRKRDYMVLFRRKKKNGN